MKTQTIKINKGFTLVETMFAVMILTFTIVGMMTVVSNSLFAARYSRDEITANYLLQEVIDYVRNDRDTTIFLQNGVTWASFLSDYNNCISPMSPDGCYFDVLSSPVTIKKCTSGACPYLYYDKNADATPFYANDDGVGNIGVGGIAKAKTSFQRKIVLAQNVSNPDEIDVTVTVTWKNGGLTMTRSLTTSLMKWQ